MIRDEVKTGALRMQGYFVNLPYFEVGLFLPEI
jgi:hypothetical protein